jgi:hypothetical protein
MRSPCTWKRVSTPRWRQAMPLVDDEPALTHTMAASVQQRIVCGEWAGQKVKRIGSGFGHEGEAPTLTGPRCASLHGFSFVTLEEVGGIGAPAVRLPGALWRLFSTAQQPAPCDHPHATPARCARGGDGH